MTDEKRAWTVRICEWETYQHYKSRNPPWIKLHRDLLDKPAWRRLHGSAAKLLLDLWMLAARAVHPGEISMRLTDLAYRLRADDAETLTDLRVLQQAEFIELSPALQADASNRKQTLASACLETEGETEAEREKSKSGASAPNPMQMLGPLIREHLYRGNPPEGYDTRRCAHVCKTLLATGRYSADDLRDAILAVPLVRAGKVTCDDSFRRFFLKHASVTMLVLNDRWGSGLVLDQLLHLAIKAEARRTTSLPGAA